ncbi:mechanosensitive ion channel family protein [Sulfitobacter sp. THAF37]|uniref:mechanosensitive ion channel family protein n=1 Tax=Sulfitobacter sp. THAF37 TaxID=2587855 RepID=UPI001562535C|nr:mechanosensitive ion channel family protein [Sulfitobacter sp. THAF37]
MAQEHSPSNRILLALDVSGGVESIIKAGQTLDRVMDESARFGPSFSVFLADMVQYGFRPLTAIGAATICLLVAILVEIALRRVFKRVAPPPDNPQTRTGSVLWRIAAEIAALVTFGLLVFLPLLIVLRNDPVATAIMVAVLTAVLLVRAAEALVRLVLLSGFESEHLTALSSADATRLYLSFVAVASLAALAYVSAGLFAQGGLAEITLLAFIFFSRGIVTLALLVAFVVNKHSIRHLLVYRRDGSIRSAAWQRFGAMWHVFAAGYIALSFLATSVLLLTGVSEANGAALWSFLVLLVAVVLSIWLDGLVQEPADDADADGSARPMLLQDIAKRTGVPSVMGAAAIALLLIWSPIWSDLPFLDVSPPVRSALLQIGVTMFLTFVMWQVVNSVSYHFGAQSQGPIHEQEPVAGTRFGTLVPLFKIMLLIGLVFVSAISALSALGVDVLPLFAGAGIIGLAIGLGSQTLVKDVVSGLFFLIDDAFRIGEYVDLGTAKGTVEKVSIRSMRLRHHLGTVHTIPYGEITTIANMSRDWVVMRAEFRVPFDVDTDNLRKRIKSLGKELLADPELGDKFLEPLKSTGVIGIEESAMIIRCKYTTRPGDQWELRRRVYEELRRLFERENIPVAVRQVHVRSPGASASGQSQNAGGAEAAYAAASGDGAEGGVGT